MIKETNNRLTITLSKRRINEIKTLAINENITVSQLISVVMFEYQENKEFQSKVKEIIKLSKNINIF